MKVQKTKLKNGLRIVTKKLDNTQSLTVLILVGAGSRYEVKSINGISHFLEHMFFKGARKYKNTKQVSEAIDSVGGEFNAFTGKEYAGYYVKVASEYLDTAIDVLSDMLTHSKFDPKEINKERGVILEEYNMYQDTPMYQIGWDFERLVFLDCPLGWDQIGTKDVIGSVTQKQFRDYFDKLYTPDNTVIAVAGDVDHQKLVKKIEKMFKFKILKKGLKYEPLKAYSKKKKLYLRNKKTEQAHVVLGFPAYPDLHPKYYASKILAVILGGNMSSRMFLGVRESQGLAYYIRTTTDDYLDCGTLTTNSGVSVDRIDLAISSIVNEYKKVAQKGVTLKELKKAKSYLKGRITLTLEDSEEYAHLLGKYELLHDKVESPEEVEKKIGAVTLKQVNAVAKELFKPEEMRLAIIGPYDDEARFEKLLKF
jgi:predicted Zn-dependent peptidase